MAIVMNLYYTGDEGAARGFAQEMEEGGTADLIRAEEGNMMYRYFFPMDDSRTVLLIDAWRDQEALDRHHASPMMAIVARLREKYGLSMRAERYVDDPQGIPQKDRAFMTKDEE